MQWNIHLYKFTEMKVDHWCRNPFIVFCLIIITAGCNKDPKGDILNINEMEDYASLTLQASDMASLRGDKVGDGITIPANFSPGIFL